MNSLKEHLVAFSDAIMAIVITIMVLEIPIRLLPSGHLDYLTLFRAIGIYFISFCFVGDLWYQGSQEFHRLKKINNKEFLIYMLFLFLLSLIPPFTRMLIEDTDRQVVLIYGVLSFAVSLLWHWLLWSFHRAGDKNSPRENWILVFRAILLVVAYFLPTIGLVVYLILPILGFLQSVIHKEEDYYLDQMDVSQKEYYLQNFSKFTQNRLRRYSDLLRSSLNDDPDLKFDPNWWQAFNQQWESELAKQTAEITEKLAQAKTEGERSHLERELSRLEMERKRLNRRVEQMQGRRFPRERK